VEEQHTVDSQRLDQAQLKASGWVGCELGMQRSSSGRLRELAGADDSGVGWTKVALGAVADVSEWKLGNSSSGLVQGETESELA
jgi:hypothetical protein